MMTDIVRTLERALADRYVIEGRLGSGATAVVVLARDIRHDRQVALKVLRPDFAETLGTERFLREIRIVAGFTHPHILPLHDSGEADGLLWYSMPLARDGSLRARLAKERPLPIAEAVKITLQTASALQYAHSKGVVHRDIKPENILLEGEEVLLADFGLARSGRPADDPGLTDPGLAVGTPIYMSPEQAAGLPSDGRADVYALACVLYEMLDGEPPFTGRTAQAVLARHRTEAPRDLTRGRTGISPQLKAVLNRGLAKLPADRYDSAAAFADALRAATADVISGEAMDLFTSDARRLVPWWRRPETVATAAISLALGMGLAIFGEGGSPLAAARPLGNVRPAPLSPAPKDDPRRMAVLYLENLTPERLPPAVADGVTEEIVDRLSRVDALSVVSLSGVRPFRGATPDVQAVGRKLEVRTVVEGGIAAVGDSIRVTLRIVDARDGRQGSAVTVTRPRSEAVQLGSAMTLALTDQLRKAVGETLAAEQLVSRTASSGAWEQLHGAEQLHQQAASALTEGRPVEFRIAYLRADSMLQRASALDPRWGDPLLLRARQRLAEAQLAIRPEPVVSDARVDSLTAEALALVARAFSLRSDSAEAFRLRGVAYWLRWRILDQPGAAEESERALLRSTALRPDFATAWLDLSYVYRDKGRAPESAVAARHAVEADPWMEEVPTLTNRLFFASLEQERFDDAEKWCTEGQRRFPDEPGLFECRLNLLSRTASGPAAIADAWQEVARIETRDTRGVIKLSAPSRRLWVAAVLARSGLVDSAMAVTRQTLAPLDGPTRLHHSLLEAYVYTVAGDRDQALLALNRYLTGRPARKAFVAESGLYRSLRDDPRFQRIVRRG